MQLKIFYRTSCFKIAENIQRLHALADYQYKVLIISGFEV